MKGFPENIGIIGPVDVLIEEITQRVQEFTVLLYEIKQCYKMNNARYQLLQKNITLSKDKEHFIKKIKGIDSNLIPPCWFSLKHKIVCITYVNSL